MTPPRKDTGIFLSTDYPLASPIISADRFLSMGQCRRSMDRWTNVDARVTNVRRPCGPQQHLAICRCDWGARNDNVDDVANSRFRLSAALRRNRRVSVPRESLEISNPKVARPSKFRDQFLSARNQWEIIWRMPLFGKPRRPPFTLFDQSTDSWQPELKGNRPSRTRTRRWSVSPQWHLLATLFIARHRYQSRMTQMVSSVVRVKVSFKWKLDFSKWQSRAEETNVRERSDRLTKGKMSTRRRPELFFLLSSKNSIAAIKRDAADFFADLSGPSRRIRSACFREALNSYLRTRDYPPALGTMCTSPMLTPRLPARPRSCDPSYVHT